MSLKDQGHTFFSRLEDDKTLRSEIEADPGDVIKREPGLAVRKELCDDELAQVSGGSTEFKVYRCTYCNFRTVDKNVILQHMADNHGLIIY